MTRGQGKKGDRRSDERRNVVRSSRKQSVFIVFLIHELGLTKLIQKIGGETGLDDGATRIVFERFKTECKIDNANKFPHSIKYKIYF